MSLNQKSPLRVCRECCLEAYTEEDLELFSKDKKHLYGRENLCKKCRNAHYTKGGRYWKSEQRRREARRKWQRLHPEEVRESQRRYRQRPEVKARRQEEHRKYRHNLYKLWNNGIDLGHGPGSVEKSKYLEDFAEKVALPALGFKDIFKTYSTFPFDFICEYEGRKALVDATGAHSRPGLKRKREYAEKLGLQFYMLVIKPDLSVYFLREVTTDSMWLPVSLIRLSALQEGEEDG